MAARHPVSPTRGATAMPPSSRALTDLNVSSTRELFAHVLDGYLTLIDDARTHAANDPRDYEHATRMLWALGSWFARPGRPRILTAPSGREIDLADLLLTSLRRGTNPQDPGHWPVSGKPWDQMVVESAQAAWATWSLHEGWRQSPNPAAEPFAALTDQVLARIHDFLARQDQSIYPHNWGLFVAANQEVRRQLHLADVPGFAASFDPAIIADRLARSQAMHWGEGWHTDSSISPSTPTFDDYTSWGYILYHLVLMLYTASDEETATRLPGFAPPRGRREMLADFARYFAFQAHQFDASGASVEYGRSQTYKFARLAAVTLAYVLDRRFNHPGAWNLGFSMLPRELSTGTLRRLIRLHLNHFISLGMIDPVTGVIHPHRTLESSPESQESYSTSGSTYWAVTLFAALWLLDDDDPLWHEPEESLPAERGDFLYWSAPSGFLLSHRAEDGHVELFNTRVHKTTTPGSDFDGKYENFVYSSAHGHLTASGPRDENNLTIGSTWRREPLSGDLWPGSPAEAPVLRSVHRQGEIIISTLLFVRTGYHVRIHRIGGSFNAPIHESSTSLGHPEATPPAHIHGPDWTYLAVSSGAIFSARLLGFAHSEVLSGTGAHTRSSAWSLVRHIAPSASPGRLLASLHRTSRRAFDPVKTRAAVRHLDADEGTARVFWGDGSESSAPFL